MVRVLSLLREQKLVCLAWHHESPSLFLWPGLHIKHSTVSILVAAVRCDSVRDGIFAGPDNLVRQSEYSAHLFGIKRLRGSWKRSAYYNSNLGRLCWRLYFLWNLWLGICLRQVHELVVAHAYSKRNNEGYNADAPSVVRHDLILTLSIFTYKAFLSGRLFAVRAIDACGLQVIRCRRGLGACGAGSCLLLLL